MLWWVCIRRGWKDGGRENKRERDLWIHGRAEMARLSQKRNFRVVNRLFLESKSLCGRSLSFLSSAPSTHSSKHSRPLSSFSHCTLHSTPSPSSNSSLFAPPRLWSYFAVPSKTTLSSSPLRLFSFSVSLRTSTPQLLD